MNILAFDTSSLACSVAIQTNKQTLSLHQIAPMQQTKLILPMIQEILDSASLNLNDLDAIAYGCGPGSFTGIRIAASVAQGLSFAAQKPLIQISSLAALAQAALQNVQQKRVLIALDARMGQIYWAQYEEAAPGFMHLKQSEQLCAPSEIQLPLHQNFCGLGDAWVKYKQELSAKLGFTPSIIDTEQLPTAEAILQLARLKFEKNDFLTAAEALPTYLR